MYQPDAHLLAHVGKPCPYCSYIDKFADELQQSGYAVLRGKRLKSFKESISAQDGTEVYFGTIARWPTRDHMIPRSKLKKAKYRHMKGAANILIVCTQCNHDKASRCLLSWLNKLMDANDPRAIFVAKIVQQRRCQGFFDVAA